MALDALGYFKRNIGGLSGNWEATRHLGGKVVRREVSSDLECQLQFVLGKLINEGVDAEGC